MGKARKKNSEDYEEDEDEDDEVDELEEDYVPSPRDRKSGGQGKSKASSIEPAGDAGVKGDAEPEAQLILIEELWVTCDRCDKWRLLPPGSIKPSENIPWWVKPLDQPTADDDISMQILFFNFSPATGSVP